MREFHHHPDDLVYLRTDAATYVAAPADFAADAAACGLPPYPGLPAGFRERRFVAGGVHAVYTADTQAADATFNGAPYLDAIDAMLAAQTAREGTA